MDAGALGVEIVISGKLRTERARFEKFRAGYFPRCGEPALRYMRKAEMHVQLKPGMIGVRVKLMPPDAIFPDKIKITIPDIVSEEETAAVLKPETEGEPAEPVQQNETEATAKATEVKEAVAEPSEAAEQPQDTEETDATDDAGKSAEEDNPTEAAK
jgi:small subunit ribosomal protein S3